jgi:hypothetical protein
MYSRSLNTDYFKGVVAWLDQAGKRHGGHLLILSHGDDGFKKRGYCYQRVAVATWKRSDVQ